MYDIHKYKYRMELIQYIIVFVVFFWYCWVAVLNFYQELRIYNLGQEAAFKDPRLITLQLTKECTEQVL